MLDDGDLVKREPNVHANAEGRIKAADVTKCAEVIYELCNCCIFSCSRVEANEREHSG